ncbi:hypothetical protein BaRGS_00010187, partial [Batillaria attramentaria]
MTGFLEMDTETVSSAGGTSSGGALLCRGVRVLSVSLSFLVVVVTHADDRSWVI